MKQASSGAIIAILAAILGGAFGSWYGGYLAHKQWRYEKTLVAYSELLRILDDAVIVSAALPGDIELAENLQKSGKESQAWDVMQKINDNKTEPPRLVARARISITDIQALHPSRLEQAAKWLEILDESIVPLMRHSINASHGDTISHRNAQRSIEQVRREVRTAQGSDLGITSNSYILSPLSWGNISNLFSPIGLILDIFGAIILICGEIHTFAARIRQHKGAIQTTLIQKLPVTLARKFGSDKAGDTSDYTVETLSTRFWGLSFLVVGFLLQFLGTVK